MIGQHARRLAPATAAAAAPFLVGLWLAVLVGCAADQAPGDAWLDAGLSSRPAPGPREDAVVPPQQPRELDAARDAQWEHDAGSLVPEAPIAVDLATDTGHDANGAGYRWTLPEYAEPPPIPEDNPMTTAKVDLGRRLFYEGRFSLDGELSCASCHDPQYAFAVPETTHRGADGETTPRNAPGLANIAYATYLTWGNLTLLTLEQQAIVPLFNDTPIEMGVGFVPGSNNHFDPSRLEETVRSEPAYQDLFAAAFPELPADRRVSWETVIAALASFQRSLVSFGSAYDRYLAGEPGALSPAQEQGRQLFFSERLKCGACHRGPLLSLAFPTDGSRPPRSQVFRNNGLYRLDTPSSGYLGGAPSYYPQPNMGIGEFTQDPADDGRHRIPSLRNVALTAPYMHDGSLSDLQAVVDHYARGGTYTPTGPNAGDGREHPAKDPLIAGFDLTSAERAALVDFMHALTDSGFVEREARPR